MHLHIVHRAGFVFPGKLRGIAANYCLDWSSREGMCRAYDTDTMSVKVDSWREIEDAVRPLPATLSAVTFHAHGNSGVLMGISAYNVEVVGRWIRPLFPGRGVVNFSACSVAAGEQGEEFMRQAARSLLPAAGGSVVAMDSSVFTYPVVGTLRPPWGNEVVAIREPDGSIRLER